MTPSDASPSLFGRLRLAAVAFASSRLGGPILWILLGIGGWAGGQHLYNDHKTHHHLVGATNILIESSVWRQILKERQELLLQLKGAKQ